MIESMGLKWSLTQPRGATGCIATETSLKEDYRYAESGRQARTHACTDTPTRTAARGAPHCLFETARTTLISLHGPKVSSAQKLPEGTTQKPRGHGRRGARVRPRSGVALGSPLGVHATWITNR